MTSFRDQVAEFHRTFGVPVADRPGLIAGDRSALRIALIAEEFNELTQAILGGDLVEIADAIADLHYVVSGTSVEYGIPEDRIFAEVHRSNMSKADPDGTIHRREDGKILKSKTWSPPDIAAALGADGTVEHVRD